MKKMVLIASALFMWANFANAGLIESCVEGENQITTQGTIPGSYVSQCFDLNSNFVQISGSFGPNEEISSFLYGLGNDLTSDIITSVNSPSGWNFGYDTSEDYLQFGTSSNPLTNFDFSFSLDGYKINGFDPAFVASAGFGLNGGFSIFNTPHLSLSEITNDVISANEPGQLGTLALAGGLIYLASRKKKVHLETA